MTQVLIAILVTLLEIIALVGAYTVGFVIGVNRGREDEDE